uniref:Ig-like domain-containing protein n=1 Tax=Gadus morhua TaxID=8049 RepID=A0A8C5B917_GADMO
MCSTSYELIHIAFSRICNTLVTDLSFLTYAGYQQSILSIQDSPVQALQGDGVTLSCNYSSATSFFWYRQYPSSPSQFLIKEYMELSGFTLKKDSDKKIMFHLEISLLISSAAVTDSALYYCALRPTVTGNTDSLYKNLLNTNTRPSPLDQNTDISDRTHELITIFISFNHACLPFLI